MIRIQKDNVQLRIDESELKSYLNDGYEKVEAKTSKKIIEEVIEKNSVNENQDGKNIEKTIKEESLNNKKNK